MQCIIMENTLIKLTLHDETKKRAHDSQIVRAKENLKLRLFGDDTSLYVIMEIPVTAALQLNTDLSLIYKWAKTWLVDFHPNKTESLNQSIKRYKPFLPLYTWVLHK